jgi:hypothetical protein
VLAVTATSGYVLPAAEYVTVEGQAIVARVPNANASVSTDGGRTWQGRPMEQADERTTRFATTSACVPGQPERCYRVTGRELRVLRSDDAGRTWRTAWEIPPGRHRLLERALHTSGLASRGLVIQERANGHVVVAVNDRDGAVVRDERDIWTRYGFDAETVLSAAAATPLYGGDHVTDELRGALLAGIWVIVAGLMIVAAGARSAARGVGGAVVSTGGGGKGAAAVHWVMPMLGLIGVPLLVAFEFLQDAVSAVL